MQDPKLDDRLASAGGVPEIIVKALESLLTSKELDGMFIAAAISLPAASELVGTIPNIDPLLLHTVRCAIPFPSFLHISHRQGMLMAAGISLPVSSWAAYSVLNPSSA